MVVTGAAGFIGSHLVDALLDRGHNVKGIDSFTEYYSRKTKLANLTSALRTPGFDLIDADLASVPLEPLLDGVDTVFHLAAQPGVRSSWATGFRNHVECNVVAIQRLLEASRSFPSIRIINSSSSSVYGNATRYPSTEDDATRPFSPYGVTKLAAEQLCGVYADNWNLSTVSLRYFSVYGPRQRPDMATYRMIESALTNTPFPVFGDGRQVRDFTFVADVVEANIRAASSELRPGAVYNIGGGSSVPILELLELVSKTTKRQLEIDWRPPVAGDALRTGADISLASKDLDWRPRTSIDEGVAAQVAWQVAWQVA